MCQFQVLWSCACWLNSVANVLCIILLANPSRHWAIANMHNGRKCILTLCWVSFLYIKCLYGLGWPRGLLNQQTGKQKKRMDGWMDVTTPIGDTMKMKMQSVSPLIKAYSFLFVWNKKMRPKKRWSEFFFIQLIFFPFTSLPCHECNECTRSAASLSMLCIRWSFRLITISFNISVRERRGRPKACCCIPSGSGRV